eukprot:jgi/Tetstr1/439772/TSEL_028185.t1
MRTSVKVAVFLLSPVLFVYYAGAALLSVLGTLLVAPAAIITRRFYWALPFTQFAIKNEFPRTHILAKFVFEVSLSINTLFRLLTIPLRPLPDFYIVSPFTPLTDSCVCSMATTPNGVKCGTTTLANYLKQHPALGGVDGPPLHDTLTKESHFYSGVLGRRTTDSGALYRSFFPTVLSAWWAEVVRGYKCFDACPANACLPYMAEKIQRLTPDAKFVFLVGHRQPLPSLPTAIAEHCPPMRNWGVDLQWSLMDEMIPDDPRLEEREDEIKLWKTLQNLSPGDPLPRDLPRLMCSRFGMYLRFGKGSDRIMPFVKRFPRSNIMFIDFKDLTEDTERTVKEVLKFVGVEEERYTHRPQPAGMKSDYKGRRVHPPTRRRLMNDFFQASNERLQAVTQRTFDWIPQSA